jgi:hypothetical protein
MSRTKNNKVYIVGTVAEVDVNERTASKDPNKKFISGKVIIKCVGDDEKESLIEVKVIANEKNKDGSANKNFISYKNLPAMLGQRVRVSGELNDESIVAEEQVRHFNTIRGTFFNKARSDEADAATFEYSGFVVKPIAERKNKDDELLGYRIEIAQANYNDTAMKVIKFDVNKNDINIAQAIESNYLTGTTVKIQGKISYESRVEVKEEEVSFGEANKKTVIYTDKVYRITGGSEPVAEDSADCYPMSEIKEFVAAYKTADAEQLAKAKAEVVDETPALSEGAKKMGSLISGSLI